MVGDCVRLLRSSRGYEREERMVFELGFEGWIEYFLYMVFLVEILFLGWILWFLGL